jgi:serine/threonine-protein kinase
MEQNQQLLHYRLVEKLGQGGMGVVWKALDTTLDREVAIKLLPPDFAADADRLARFDREARLLASLSHPNIAGIYGIHECEGTHFLAMELVPGQDLSQRLEGGAVPVEEALRIAREVATAVEAAHENGVIHRDLKPANVKLTADGKAKVLDFGLAKAATPANQASGDASVEHSPTMTSAGTVAGMILGTASYMSPEQASGQPIDRRSDIWSFGVMLHELLTGERLFDGESVSHTLAGVLRDDLDLDDLPEKMPRGVRLLLGRCLERDVTRRLRDIGEARIALDDAIERPHTEAADADAGKGAATGRKRRLPWLVAAAVLVVAVGGSAMLGLREAPEPEPVRRFALATPSASGLRHGDGRSIAISPDGRRIVTRSFVGSDVTLFIRDLDDFEPRQIPGSEGATAPHFSPDGDWVSFSTSSGLFKLRPDGGASIRIGALPASSADYHWASDGFFYYQNRAHLWRLSEDGGEPEQLTTNTALDDRQLREPFAVPEAGIVFCSTGGGRRDSRLMAFDLDEGTLVSLDIAGIDPRYLPTGHLLFRQDDQIVVAKFDIDALEFETTPVPVIPRAMLDAWSMQVDVAQNGTVAYMPRRPDGSVSLVFVDMEGRAEAAATTELPFTTTNDLRFSPDGNRLTVSVGVSEIWMIDLPTQIPTLLTESGFYPVWSPDGREIVYGSVRGETYDVYRVPVDLSRPEHKVLDVENNLRTMEWTPQGALILREEIPDKGMDLRYWPDVDDEKTLTNLLDGPDDELAPDVSPDGRWMAYVSDYSGSDEIYVTSFPETGARTQISNNGGHSPCWSPDGKTLYYLEGLKMMAVSLETSPAVRVLERRELFEGPYVQYRWSRQYDLSPDGKRFVMTRNPPSSSIEVITNWFEELRQND